MKPEIVEAIEAVLGKNLAQSPSENQPDPLRTLVAIQNQMPHKYLLDNEGRLVGLNLSSSGLNDEQWQQIVNLLNKEAISLQALNLSDNQLQDFLMPAILEKLKILDLSENQFTMIKLDANKINALREVYLADNPLTAPPPEIVQQGSKAVLAWFASFKEDTGATEQYLREIKIMLVGEGLAGKTSLLKRIKGLPFDEQENQTHGVNVETLEMGNLQMFQPYAQLKDVKARIWDFGGQEIMHASHQFFLTHRSIYIFVVDSRTDNKKGYWLRHIQEFGGASPTIVAMNKIDSNPNYSLQEATLNEKYPFIGNRFVKISCDTGEGMDQFAYKLAELIPTTELFNTPISSNWLQIKNTLEQDTAASNYINHQRFLEICAQNKVNDVTAQDALLNYLHTLGVVLHFKELSLQRFYILDPHWVTIGVYKIINSHSIIDGILREEKLNFILNQEKKKRIEYEPSQKRIIHYSLDEQLYLISIMKEFELLYEYDKGCYLVPDLLPKELPDTQSFGSEQAVTFIMEYDFLPPNIMTRFMISMKDDIYDLSKLWRYGVLLTNEQLGCTALIKVIEENKLPRIIIFINGQERRKREYFAIVHHKLYSINGKFKGLQIKQFMPVPGYPDIEVDYDDLLRHEKNGRNEIYISSLNRDYDVSKDFLDKISTKGARVQGKNFLDADTGQREIIRALDRVEQNTQAILTNQESQQKYLSALITFASGKYQPDMQAYYDGIDALENSDQDLVRINALLDTQLNSVFSKLPDSEKTVQGWNEAKTKLSYKADIKTKLKFKIPFVFGEIEQEFGWDTRALLKSLRQEWIAFKERKKTLQQLFRDDE